MAHMVLNPHPCHCLGVCHGAQEAQAQVALAVIAGLITHLRLQGFEVRGELGTGEPQLQTSEL